MLHVKYNLIPVYEMSVLRPSPTLEDDDMCTRQQALRRLTGRWLEDPATVHQMPLRAVLVEENIRAVMALNLYPDFDDFGERQRGREIIRHWISPRRHGWAQ